MKNTILLLQTFNKNMKVEKPEKKGKANLYQLFGILTMALIMIPCCIIIGVVVYFLTQLFMDLGGLGQGLELVIQILSAFGVIFTIMVVFNVLYFSSDLNHLLAMPIKPGELVTAKFIHIYFAESVMEFMILFAAVIGFFLSAGVNPVSFMTGLIGVLLLPVLPLVYCGIFALLSMAFFYKIKILRNVEVMAGLFSCLFAFLFVASFAKMDAVNIISFLKSLLYGKNIFINVLGKVFFTVPLFMKALTTSNVFYLSLYILLNVAALGILFFLGNLLYIKGVHLVFTNSDTKEKRGRKLTEKDYKKKTKAYAYFIKECKILNRTPAYRKYCAVVNVIWPILALGIFYIPVTRVSLEIIRKRLHAGSNIATVSLLCMVVLLGFFATALNSIAATSFSREGRHMDFMKFIPVDPKLQIRVKAYVSMIYSGIPVVLAVILLGIEFRCPIVLFLVLVLASILCIILCTNIGILLDAMHPKLDWDDEYGALRGNVNAFFNMAIVCMVGMLLCLICFVLWIIKVPWVITYFINIVLLAVANMEMLRILGKIELSNVS